VSMSLIVGAGAFLLAAFILKALDF
jgi:hypothetical protein